MSDEANQNTEQGRKLLQNAEEQISDLIRTIEDQDAQVWAYLIGGVVALLVGLLAAYFYAQSVREKRKTRLERLKDALRGGLQR
ncbi:MAG: DUF3185 family protein [Anaerolineae bacterium]|nr:DUF3185 family protein [Anaerolineae bacterium]